jgi:eukaryotic-like serine/threonine-protein kinase
MATMFGRFEIQSELSKSETALIYKAMDTETNQVVALKTQSLDALGDRADAFVEALIAEGESARELVLPNIVLLYGAGEIDGQFCAAMEYIQGNSIATMLARKEGFSIWDLLDITRQVCGALEHAAAKGVTHYSLEPAKIMVQWDGMVKILGYGISTMSLIEAESGKGLGRLLPYCSPEQTRGEAIDLRSNLFTLGTILYEMVVGRLAFDGADPATLASRIQDDTPAVPSSVNPKIHPAVSALIMKALAKDPAERYQSARELVDDLEKCKENKKAAADTKRPTQAPKVEVNAAARAAAASKFASAPSSAPAASAPAVAPKPVAPVPPRPVAPGPVGPASLASRSVPSGVSPAKPPAVENRATAAAAGAGSVGGARRLPNANPDASFGSKSDPGLGSSYGLKSDAKSNADFDTDLSSQPMGEFEVSGADSQAAASPVLSAAVEPETEQESPRVAVDPMMSEPVASSAGTSFSDMAEMPPLKEPVLPPPVPEPVAAPRPTVQFNPRKTEEKPRIQPREVAGKAMKEIATVPPRLMLYSILGAVGLILVIVIALFFHVRSEDDGSTAAPQPTKAAKSSSDEPVEQTPVAPRAENPAPAVAPITEPQPSLTVRQVERRNANNRRKAPAPAPVVIPGQALIDSTPQGAQFQVDGKSDPSWVTPFTVVNLGPGKHVVSVSKAGYSSDIRSVEVAAGSKSSLVLHLAPINALMVVNSTPAGASVILDGKSTGRVTPAQFAVEKGNHTVLLRKQGYLDETAAADLGPGQNFQYSPALRALGNVEEMRTVGKFNKMFGRGGDATAGMGTISIHTQPKGAQIAINQRLLEKLSPVDVMLGPGNYVVDITLTGFRPVHKVVNIDKGGKTAVDEILERE